MPELLSVLRSAPAIHLGLRPPHALVMPLIHSSLSAVGGREGYEMERWIREWNALSRVSARLVVRNMVPSKYSRIRRNAVGSDGPVSNEGGVPGCEFDRTLRLT